MIQIKLGDALGEAYRRQITEMLVRGFAEDQESFAPQRSEFRRHLGQIYGRITHLSVRSRSLGPFPEVREVVRGIDYSARTRHGCTAATQSAASFHRWVREHAVVQCPAAQIG